MSHWSPARPLMDLIWSDTTELIQKWQWLRYSLKHNFNLVAIRKITKSQWENGLEKGTDMNTLFRRNLLQPNSWLVSIVRCSQESGRV